jgi:succinoglycan biosynthesis transport protein ExoP
MPEPTLDRFAPLRPRTNGTPTALSDFSTAPGELSTARVLVALRRRWRLVLATTLLATAVAAVSHVTAIPQYSAVAVLRLGSERQAVAGDIETAPQQLSRSSDPLLSLVQLLESRAVVGAVVDSLGLRLVPLKPRHTPRMLFGRSRLLPKHLDSVRVEPGAPVGTISFEFSSERFVATSSEGAGVQSRYGVPVRLGGTRFIVPSAPGVATAAVEIVPRDEAIDHVLANLSVRQRGGTDVVDVRYTDADASRARDVANLAVLVFQMENIGSSREIARHRREFAGQQLRETDSLLAAAQGALTAFRSRQQLSSASDNLAAEQAAAMALNARRAELEADQRVFASLLAKLKSAADSERVDGLRALAYSPEVGGDPRVARLHQQIFTYQSRLDSLTTGQWRSADTNPDVLQLRTLLRSSQEELVRMLQSRLTALDERRQALASLSSRSGATLRAMPALEAAQLGLEQRVGSLTSLHDQLQRDFEMARMAEAVQAGAVDVIDLAPLPYEPSGLPSWLRLAVALLLGLLLGGAIAFLLDTRRSIACPEDVQRVLHMQDLVVIPPVAGATHGIANRLHGLLGPGDDGRTGVSAEIAALAAQPTAAAEAFRMLRTGLLWSGVVPQLRSIAVTSSLPGEGKTLTALNLAVTFARDGRRVLLVDADLRGARLHCALRISRWPGLSDLLQSDGSLGRLTEPSWSFLPGPSPPSADAGKAALIHSTAVPGLWLLPAGNKVPGSAGLMTEPKLKRLLESAARSFDVVVLDVPPLLVSADAAILAGLADGAVFVVSAGRTGWAAAERARRQLDTVGAHVLGAVLNDPEGRVPSFGDYYYPYHYEHAAAE